MRFCPNCNLEYEDKYAFCHHCGSKLQDKAEQIFCPYCGNKVETDGAFCPYCGNSITDEPSVTASVPLTNTQYTSANSNQSTFVNNAPQVKPEEQEEAKGKGAFTSIIKVVLYFIGGFFLLFIMKVLTKGMVKSYMRDGFSLGFFISFIIVGAIIYYFMYGNRK